MEKTWIKVLFAGYPAWAYVSQLNMKTSFKTVNEGTVEEPIIVETHIHPMDIIVKIWNEDKTKQVDSFSLNNKDYDTAATDLDAVHQANEILRAELEVEEV